jgi:hypothetical protein
MVRIVIATLFTRLAMIREEVDTKFTRLAMGERMILSAVRRDGQRG